MIIGIISDTHDRLDKISEAVNYFNSSVCDLVLHCGDYISPFAVKALHRLNAKIIGVYGNNDGERNGIKTSMRKQDELYNGPYAFQTIGKRFMIMHEPNFLHDFAESGNYDYIVYGHLHEQDYQEYKEGSTVIINPGECCGWVSGKSSVAVLDTSTKKVHFQEF